MPKFVGAPYPIIKSPRGYFGSQSDIDQIKSDMLILLLTNPGERVMLPSFGTPLRELYFEPNDPTLRQRARAMIITAIELWEPRVSIEQIEVLAKADDNSLNAFDDKTEAGAVLMIRIMFKDPQDISSVHELKLEVPLGGAQ